MFEERNLVEALYQICRKATLLYFVRFLKWLKVYNQFRNSWSLFYPINKWDKYKIMCREQIESKSHLAICSQSSLTLTTTTSYQFYLLVYYTDVHIRFIPVSMLPWDVILDTPCKLSNPSCSNRLLKSSRKLFWSTWYNCRLILVWKQITNKVKYSNQAHWDGVVQWLHILLVTGGCLSGMSLNPIKGFLFEQGTLHSLLSTCWFQEWNWAWFK